MENSSTEQLRARFLYWCSSDFQRKRLLAVMRRRSETLRYENFLTALLALAQEETDRLIEQGECIGEGQL